MNRRRKKIVTRKKCATTLLFCMKSSKNFVMYSNTFCVCFAIQQGESCSYIEITTTILCIKLRATVIISKRCSKWPKIVCLWYSRILLGLLHFLFFMFTFVYYKFSLLLFVLMPFFLLVLLTSVMSSERLFLLQPYIRTHI